MANAKTENIDVENGLLFSIFKFKQDAIKEIVKEISLEDFANPTNRMIAGVIFREYDKTGTTFSVPGLYSFMCSLNETTDEDKIKIKNALQHIGTAAIAFNDIRPHCRVLRHLCCVRKYLKSINTNLDELDKVGIEDALNTMEKNIQLLRKKLDASTSRNITAFKGDIDQRIKYAEKIDQDPTSVGLVRFGFKNFDQWLPPISPGSLIIYQARTNKGKSMFLMGTGLYNYNLYGIKTIIITIEMSDKDYAFRMDSNVTGFEHSEFAKGTISKDPNMVSHWKTAVNSFGQQHTSNGDIFIYWVPENCTPAKVDAIISSNPFKPDLVIIDYAGDMKSGLKGVPDYDPASQGHIYSRLKELAGKHECVIYTAQQTKRGAKKVTDETGSWSDVASHKADAMIAIEETKEDELHEEEVEGDRIIGRLTVSIIKGRNIPKLKTHIVPRFHKMRWLEKVESKPTYAGGIEYEKTNKQSNKESAEQITKEMEKAKDPEEPKSDEMLDGLLN